LFWFGWFCGLLVLGLDLATLLSLVTLFASGSMPPRWLPDSPSPSCALVHETGGSCHELLHVFA
jgi:hypothetical protein